ncbi:MAG: hypothetical protein ACXW0S_10980 [Solirubrobacterales bacterium]
MRRVLTSALVVLLPRRFASGAQGATKIRHHRADMFAGGTIKLEIVFKNTRSERKLFTPRRVTRVGFESVPLTCANNPGGPTSQLQLTRSVQAKIVVQPAAPPDSKPTKGRYRFIFAWVLPDLPSTTISGKIDKPDKRKRGTRPRARGRFTIADLNLGPGFTNCATNGSPEWSAPRPEND